MSGQQRALQPFTPGEERTPVYIGKEVEWTPEPGWAILKSLKFVTIGTQNFNHSVAQPVGSRYTDCATAAATK
jgi:hypothetical protein